MDCLGKLGICLEVSWGAREIEQEMDTGDREQCKGNCVCRCQFCHSTGRRREGSGIPSKE